jgi:tetraprenyl-beta-curcumene synthase
MSAGSNGSLVHDLNTVVSTVLRSPTRLRRLLALGPRGLASMARFLGAVVPRASQVLRTIEDAARRIPEPALREQALASISDKAYHVQGGCILATFLKGDAAALYVDIVAPLETIYDYLDNLCDRLPDVPVTAYPTLHEALLDALDDRRPIADYYRDGPRLDDGGYLRGLVERVRAGITVLPNYRAVRAELAQIAGYYAELQTFKHAGPGAREAVCTAWYERNRARFPGLYWWEFAAACGSSLPVFALLYLASQPALAPDAVDRTLAAYFPNVSAVHILLDYFIDQAEDREHRELNFIACYASSAQAVSRVRRLVATTAARVRTLKDGEWHAFVLRAMCLFYLTHPKVYEQHLDAESTAVLAALG